MDDKDLLKLIEEDDSGLLDVSVKNNTLTPEDRLIRSFQEINDFYSKHGKEPIKGGGMQEYRLASRLHSIRQSEVNRSILLDYDKYDLLLASSVEPSALSDILEEDDDLLSVSDLSVLKMQHIPVSRDIPEFVAKRRPCKNFSEYEPFLVACQNELLEGRKKIEKVYKYKELAPGIFFVLRGVLGYIADSQALTKNDQSKLDARLHIIFENGTESRMYLQSLHRAIQQEGGGVIKDSGLKPVDEGDVETGVIYILSSLSNDPRIKSIKSLYKIGFSTGPVESRIANAEKDPTYLMAPVRIVETYECYNMKPQLFEQLTHRFFSDVKLNLEISTKNGPYVPQEWFIIPLREIELAVSLLVNGDISQYKYDRETQSIVSK